MKLILNYIFRLNSFKNFNIFLAKKLIKFSKIFFVETNLTNLPKQNHPIQLNLDNELKKIIKYNKKLTHQPFISYSHLLDLLEVYSNSKRKIRLFDYGAGNLELFFYLRKKLNSFTYYYYDQDQYLELANTIKKKFRLDNLIINKKNKKNKIDFVYFGSVVQYIKDYKNEISFFFKKTKYIIISQTPFYYSKNKQSNIIVKQINLFPTINYMYFINIDLFIKFMKKNNYILVGKTINKVIKFLNFKNFNYSYKNLQMYDLVFKYYEKK